MPGTPINAIGNFLAGKNAAVLVGAVAFRFNVTDYNIEGDHLDTSNYLSAGQDENIDGFSRGDITLGGSWDAGGMPFTVNQMYTLLIYFSATINYTVPARLKSIKLGTKAKDHATVSLNFKTNGPFAALII